MHPSHLLACYILLSTALPSVPRAFPNPLHPSNSSYGLDQSMLVVVKLLSCGRQSSVANKVLRRGQRYAPCARHTLQPLVSQEMRRMLFFTGCRFLQSVTTLFRKKTGLFMPHGSRKLKCGEARFAFDFKCTRTDSDLLVHF